MLCLAGKVYNEIEEEKKHYDIFLDNLRMIEKHNADYVNGKKSHYMGINLFTDMVYSFFFLLHQKNSICSATKLTEVHSCQNVNGKGQSNIYSIDIE